MKWSREEGNDGPEEKGVGERQGEELRRLVQLFLHGFVAEQTPAGGSGPQSAQTAPQRAPRQASAVAILAECLEAERETDGNEFVVYDLEVVDDEVLWRAWRTRPHKRDLDRLIQGSAVSWENRFWLFSDKVSLTLADFYGLALAEGAYPGWSAEIKPEWRAAALRAIVESGRAFWQRHTYGVPLRWSPEEPRIGWLWRQDAKGRFVGMYVVPGGLRQCELVTNTFPWHYVLPYEGLVGAFAPPEGVSWPQLIALQRLPPVAAEEVEDFSRLWCERMPRSLPPPKPVEERVVEELPRFGVRLFRDEAQRRWIEPSVAYGPVRVLADGAVEHPFDGVVVRIPHRDRQREQAWFLANALFWTGAGDVATQPAFAPALSPAQWLEKRAAMSRALAEFAPEVEVADDFWPSVERAKLEAISLTPVADDPDWFEWRGEVHLSEGVRVPVETIAAELFARYGAQGWPEELVVEVPGDAERCAVVPLAPIEPVLRLALELLARDPKRQGARRVSRYDVALLEAVPEALWPVKPPAFAEMLAELRAYRGPQPVEPPAALQAQLRPYQCEGLAWLQFWRRHRLHGILADDMGLGKTLQTLAHLVQEQAAGRLTQPALVVAPTSLIGNWLREAARFAPTLQVMAWHGAAREEQAEAIAAHEVVVTSYPLLWRDIARLRAQAWSVVILDEAQAIKNPRAKVASCARQLAAEQRLCLTGTPMENHVGELWALFDFLLPGFLGSHDLFQRAYRTPIEKQGDTERLEYLRRRIKPFFLRRTKEEVAKELPAKSVIVETVTLGERQAKVYEAIRVAMEARVRQALAERGLAKSQITVLDALLKLRQVCCHPALVDAEHARRVNESAKFDWLYETLPELVSEGRRVLLFSQFVQLLRKVEALLGELGLPYTILTGETKARDAAVARFQSGEVPIFLLSLKAGGTGLNLTAADTVVLLDPWWNPAVEEQAIDRAHRIGQDKPVFIYKLICANTVEEQILKLQAEKQALVAAALEGGGAKGLAFNEAEVAALFAVTPVA